MAKNQLNALFVKNAPIGRHDDGEGLRLVVRSPGTGNWIFRYTFAGKRVDFGLGSKKMVSLAEARKLRDQYREVLNEGIDPRTEKKRREAEERKRQQATNPSFEDVAHQCFEARKAELKGDGKAGRWFSPLAIHVLPKIGRRKICEIDQSDLVNVFKPIWHSKPETARKVVNRTRIVLEYATALGVDVQLDAPKKAEILLGKRRHTAKPIPAMHWQDVPNFYATLMESSPTHLALRLTILTAQRLMPIRHCSLDQIRGDTWTVPGELMKGRRGKTSDFRIPLSPEARAVIEKASKMHRDGHLFPGLTKGVVSDRAIEKLMDRAGVEARPHGFRSSFRSWVADTQSASREIAETAVGHLVGTEVERAYQRSDLLEQRRVVMEAWAQHVLGQRGEVVRLTQ